MKTIASPNTIPTTAQPSLELSQLISDLSSLDTDLLKQIIRSLGAELAERQEISLSDILQEIFSEKSSQKNSPKPLDQLIHNLKNLLPKIQDQYKIRSLGIFGSYVRGEETAASDLDLLVDFEQDSSTGLIKICELENYLTEQLGIQVDITLLTELKSPVSQQILSEVSYIYEA